MSFSNVGWGQIAASSNSSVKTPKKVCFNENTTRGIFQNVG